MKDSNSVERDLRGNQTHLFIFQKEPEAWVGVLGNNLGPAPASGRNLVHP